MVVGEDMAASLGVAPRGPPHPRGRCFARFVCGLLPLSPLSDADESVCRRPRSAVRRPGPASANALASASSGESACRRATSSVVPGSGRSQRASYSLPTSKSPTVSASPSASAPAAVARCSRCPAVRRWPSRPSSCWAKYACSPSLNSENPVPAPTSDPSATRTPNARCAPSGNIPLPRAALLVGQCATGDAAAAEHPQLALGRVHVVREHRPRSEQPVLVVAGRVVAAEQLADAADLLGVLVEVRGEERAGYVAQQGPGRLQQRVGAGEREARRDGVPAAGRGRATWSRAPAPRRTRGRGR